MSVSMPVKKQLKSGTAKRKGTDTRQSLNMRIRPDMRALIDRAAKISGKNRTDFVLDAARDAALNAVLDETNIVLDPKSYEEFVARLDAPPQPNACLRKALTSPAPWD